jgi:hypothetical protein
MGFGIVTRGLLPDVGRKHCYSSGPRESYDTISDPERLRIWSGKESAKVAVFEVSVSVKRTPADLCLSL